MLLDINNLDFKQVYKRFEKNSWSLKCVHVNIYKTFTKKNMNTHFSLLSYQKTDFDKSKVKTINDPLQCEGWTTQKAHVISQYVKKKKKKKTKNEVCLLSPNFKPGSKQRKTQKLKRNFLFLLN